MKKFHEKSVDLQNFFENFITFLFELTLYVNLNGKQSYNHPSLIKKYMEFPIDWPYLETSLK